MFPEQPNPYAKERPSLGFLLASLNTGASQALWPGMLDAAERHDVNLISFPGGRLNASNAFESQRNRIFDLASAEYLDGLVTWASSLGGVLSPGETSAFHLRYQGLPMVSLASFMAGLPSVALDSYQGMRSLLIHLIKDHGYERLAFIRGPEEHYYAQERYHAYLDTLQAFGLPVIPQLVTRPLRWESGAEAVQVLLDERNLKPGADFQAVVAVSDLLAVWALKTLQSRGYKIPDDVAVTGFNNSIEERLATPPLTTVDLPFHDQGVKAVDMLLAQMHGEAVPALLTLPSRLVVRQSCGCPSAAVQMAGYIPEGQALAPGPVLERLHSSPARHHCLAEMMSAIDPASPDSRVVEALLVRLLEDLENILSKRPGSSLFLQELSETLKQVTQSQPELGDWNRAISILRRWILPGLGPEQSTVLEALFGQARVVIGEADRRSQSYWQWQAERQAEALREINRSLLTTFDIHQLGNVLCEQLPKLGIPSAHLVLYENPDAPLEYARLVMSFTEQGPADLEPEGWRFPTRQLVPQQFLPQHRRYSLVVEPLYFQQKSLGYLVLEIGTRNGDVYEAVRSNLSSAIQGAMLFSEIQRARLAAEKADRIKARLLANVSHELRTPLNIIIGTTQDLLSSQGIEPSLGRDILGIQNHAEHQLRVINDLLDLSRAEIDELDLALELIDPLPLLSDAFHALADHTDNPNIEWTMHLPERLPLIRADALRLRQILLNLLSNASKYTESGRVTLGAEILPPHIHLWVSDTGGGIPPEQQERIFEPFVIIEQNRRIAGGIGLGLSISRRLVALHGGKMALDSEMGQGSTFHIYLPLPALEQDRTNTENAQPVLLLLSTSGQPAAEIQAISQRQNLQICLVHTIDELEAVLANTRPVAVAWDLTNARPGDWNLVRHLRHHPTICQAPFILYGQLPESETAVPTLGLGMTSFVAKSPNPGTILETINTLCPAGSTGMILIVDDEPEVRSAHQKLIERGLPGCRVVPAEDGAAALAVMKNEIPGLVLLDLVMPGLGGAEVLDQMRSDPRLRQVPVVVLSSKLLNLEDVKRIEHHNRVTLQSKGIWSEAETVVALNRILFDADFLPAHTSALVKRAVAYLHQNFSRQVARWEVAEAVGVSEDYLSRVFNRELEISPWDYLNRYRVLHAQRLLRTTSHSIAEIAHAVGFKDQAYFSRVFSKQVGSSPQSYRGSP